MGEGTPIIGHQLRAILMKREFFWRIWYTASCPSPPAKLIFSQLICMVVLDAAIQSFATGTNANVRSLANVG